MITNRLQFFKELLSIYYPNGSNVMALLRNQPDTMEDLCNKMATLVEYTVRQNALSILEYYVLEHFNTCEAAKKQYYPNIQKASILSSTNSSLILVVYVIVNNYLKTNSNINLDMYCCSGVTYAIHAKNSLTQENMGNYKYLSAFTYYPPFSYYRLNNRELKT